MLEALDKRRTYKVIGNVDHPTSESRVSAITVDKIVENAGNAPVHYACDRVHLSELTSPVPWRCYKLDGSGCRTLMNILIEAGDTTKVPNMLAAADYLLQVTWLPDDGTIVNPEPDKEEQAFTGTLRNMEHIAAASAFIQSLLLAAESEGFKTYWSSGGPLRKQQTFSILGIPPKEILLGSVFLFPSDPENAEIKAGNLAEKRGEPSQWSKWLEID